jgi:hypothetical protein
MAGKWLEGFESHTNSSQLARKYATFTGSVSVQSGRVFGNAGGMASTVAVSDSLGLADTWIVGFGVRITSRQTALNSGAQGIYIEKASTEQFHLEFVNNVGSFEVRLMRGATQLAITTGLYAYGNWHHFEVKVLVNTATGTYEIRHDEVLAVSGTGVNTANAGSNQADIFALRFTSNVGTTFMFDDMNVKDGTGATNNDFLGDFIVEACTVNGAGASTQWTNDAGSGSNFNNVQDPGNAAPDESGAGGTNSSDTSGQKDLYALTDLAHIDGSIAFVQIGAQLGMLAAGSRNVLVKYRDDGGTDATAATVTVASTTFDEFPVVLDQNPVTATPWDVSDINGGQIGVEVA